MGSNHLDSDQAYSGVAQTANVGSATSVSSGAAKIFREFKWGLLTLFILMAVVVGLVYDGGRNKKKSEALLNQGQKLDAGLGMADPTVQMENPIPAPGPVNTPGPTTGGLGGASTPITGGANEPLGTIPGRNRAQLLDEGTDTWSPTPIPDQPMRPNRNASTQGSRTGAHEQEENARSGRSTPPADSRRLDSTPARRNAVETTAGPKLYVVKAGDSLSKISSANQLGKNGVKMILDANKETLTNPDRLREGMKLRIPTATGTTPANGVVEGAPRNAPPARSTETHQSSRAGTQETYVVQSGDSLERIARRELNDARKWKELLEWNKDKLTDPSKLKAGMTLRMYGGASCPAPQHQHQHAADTVRYRDDSVRAQAEPFNEPPMVDEAEVVPLPVSPVSASRKMKLPEAKSLKYEHSNGGGMLPEPDNLPGELLFN